MKKYKRVRIIGHAQSFWSHISADVPPPDKTLYPTGPVKSGGLIDRLLAEYPNLYADMSAGSGFNALNRDREYAVQFLNEFQDRLLFGTDICHFEQTFPLRDLLLEWRATKKISESVFQKIAHDNAVKLFGLDDG